MDDRDGIDHVPAERSGHGSDAAGLREYVQQLEAIGESSTDALLVKDAAGRYQFANEAAADFLDCERDDVVGATDEQLFGEEYASELRRRERWVLETERTETTEETLPVADALGVSSPTFHQYVRKAQRALLIVFFDSDAERP